MQVMPSGLQKRWSHSLWIEKNINNVNMSICGDLIGHQENTLIQKFLSDVMLLNIRYDMQIVIGLCNNYTFYITLY